MKLIRTQRRKKNGRFAKGYDCFLLIGDNLYEITGIIAWSAVSFTIFVIILCYYFLTHPDLL